MSPPTTRATAPGLRDPPPATGPRPALDALPTERGFAALCAAYRSSGGIERGDDLARLLEEHQLGNFVSLARLIVTRELFCFEWRDAFWVPMFQFELRDLSIRPGPQRVLAELVSRFDGWSLATWFAKPNAWLDERRPLDLLDENLALVLQAAHADRFAAAG